MTIDVTKTGASSAVSEDVYKIELTAIELHYMMTVLKLFNRHAVGSTSENDFACKSARIMQDSMIANGDYM